jgi:hypothetical protein
MTQYVQLSADTTKVVTLFAGPQAVTSDKPGYAEIEETDARYLAFQTAQEAHAAAASLIAGPRADLKSM